VLGRILNVRAERKCDEVEQYVNGAFGFKNAVAGLGGCELLDSGV
jgi:hypothetical protein